MRRWSLDGSPRGVAVTTAGQVYVGLAGPQAVVSINPQSGKIEKEVVLDSEEIASTKELVTLRLTADEKRLVIANGSDESVTIASVPELTVLREIGLEGETIRDAVPDPRGRYLYILGRAVHVWDFDGSREIRSLSDVEPMAIAVSADGSMFAIVGSETFTSGKATVAALYDAATLKEIDRVLLQTDRTIDAALFAAGRRALVVVADDWIAEKPLEGAAAKTMEKQPDGAMRISIGFGDLVNSQRICLPDDNGPQIAVLGKSPDLVVFGEKPCSAGETFNAAKRITTPASIYGISAWGLAYDAKANVFYATDSRGFLTAYKAPAN